MSITAAPTRAAAEDTSRALWDRFIDPHGPQIDLILARVKENRAAATDRPMLAMAPGPVPSEIKHQALNDALAMLAVAARLAPTDPRVLELQAFVADDLGRSELAYTALLRVQAMRGEQTPMEAYVRLGRIYADRQKWDLAVTQLRFALGHRFPKRSGERHVTTFLLANTYMHVGRMAEAIELLLPAGGGPSFAPPVEPLLSIALAVAYDRDEQLSNAHRVLVELMKHDRADEAMLYWLFDRRQRLRPHFAPSADRHYYSALVFETVGMLPEAREAWAAYAQLDHSHAPFRHRALAHIRAVDRLLNAPATGTSR